MGWRYTYWTFGGITTLMWIARFAFKIYETPKFLLGQGRNAQAAMVVQNIARRDGKETWLTVSHFDDIDAQLAATDSNSETTAQRDTATGSGNVIRRNVSKFSPHRVKGLFATPRMALSTTLMLFLCGSAVISCSWNLLTCCVRVLDRNGISFVHRLHPILPAAEGRKHRIRRPQPDLP